MSLQGSIARKRLRKLAEVKDITKTPPKRVSWHLNGTDFLCAMLFNAGMETWGIAQHTNLTEGQVNYRIQRYEADVRAKAKREGKPFMTARRMYRKGISPVSKMIVSQLTGSHSMVKKYVAGVLDRRGLYNPPASGVLRHDKKATGSK